jgi:hypothetical protein
MKMDNMDFGEFRANIQVKNFGTEDVCVSPEKSQQREILFADIVEIHTPCPIAIDISERDDIPRLKQRLCQGEKYSVVLKGDIQQYLLPKDSEILRCKGNS